MIDPKQFERGSDFRGDYPRQVNEELAFFVGRYLVKYLKDLKEIPASAAPKIVVGRDGRLTSPAIYAALIQGISSAGGIALPGGLATTDTVCWAAGARLNGADAGVMITASHNPPEYNGIKMVRPIKTGALPGLDTIRPTYLKPYLEADSKSVVAAAASASSLPFPGTPVPIVQDFVRHACRWAPDRASFTGTIVIDPGNGVGSVLLDPLRAEVPGARVDAIAAMIDGRFPSRPSNPGLPGALDALGKAVRERGALFGAAFDGDADRLFMVDENGDVISGDQLLEAIIAFTLPAATGTNKSVAFTGTCSWGVVDTIQQFGGTPYLCKVGQDTLKAAMQKVGTVWGGESSAHYNFPESYYQDSGIIALMAFWQALHAGGKTVSEVIEALPCWHHSGEINIRVQSDDWQNISKQVVDQIAGSYREGGDSYVLEIDGVSVYTPKSETYADESVLFAAAPGDKDGQRYRHVMDGYRPDWWFSIRRSNNEPLLRLNVESSSGKTLKKKTVQMLQEVRGLCKSIGGAATDVVDWGTLKGLKKKAAKKK